MITDKSNASNLEILIEKTGILEIFGDDKRGIQALAGFLKEAAEGNFGNPEDIFKWQKIGKSFLKHFPLKR